MNCIRSFIALLTIGGGLLTSPCHAQLFTVDIPDPVPPAAVTNLLVSHGDQWQWRRGTTAPQADWLVAPDSALDATWSVAPGGFGYGDDAIVGEATRVNPGMSNIHSTLYLRRTLVVPTSLDTNANLILKVDYDDGFVAYLDGVEIARRNVPGTAGSPVLNTATTGAVSHEASCCQSGNAPVVIELGPAGGWLGPADHVFAVIGVNQSIGSSDFHIIPDLFTVLTLEDTNAAPLVNKGLYALTTNSTVTLRGSNTIAAGVRVTVNGDDATLDSLQGTWSKDIALQPGWNNAYLAVHDLSGAIITNIEQGIVYQAGAMRVGGTLADTVTWNDPSVVIYLTNSITVPAGASLNIGAGVVVVLPAGMSITANAGGTIEVQGADSNRALFLPADTAAWGSLMANGTNALLNLRYAEVVAGQVRVNTGGSALVEDSIIRDLPDLSREVIASVSGTDLTLRRTYMTRFTEGDSRDTPVLVEGCLMEGFLVDGMDIKAANSPLLVRRSTFRNADPNNSNADAIDFGPGAGTVERCLIHDFPDKGVSIGGAPGTLIRDSLIYRCGIGISAYASTGLVIENNTIANCRTGILFRDNPTRAVGVATNLVVWGNITNVAVIQTSALTMGFSDVDGTNYPGSGNISADPLFMDALADDYRLGAGSPALGAASDGGDMGTHFPVGGMPSAPERLAALAGPNGELQLAWVDTSENEDGFVIQRSADGTQLGLPD